MGPIQERAFATDDDGVTNIPELVEVPPLRLGRLLNGARNEAGRSLEDIARSPDVSMTMTELIDIEAGRRQVDGDELEQLIAEYGIAPAAFLPERATLVIDLDENVLRTDDVATELGFDDDADHVLTRYLGLVYSVRDLKPGTPVPLRDLDVDVLAEALARPSEEIADALRSMMAAPSADVVAQTRRFRTRRLMPVAGVVIGATALGAIIAVANNADADTDPVGGTDPALAGVVELDSTPLIPEPSAIAVDSVTLEEPATAASPAPVDAVLVDEVPFASVYDDGGLAVAEIPAPPAVPAPEPAPEPPAPEAPLPPAAEVAPPAAPVADPVLIPAIVTERTGPGPDDHVTSER